MIDKLKYSECTLCKACSNVCPVGCVEYNNKQKSFLYPTINYHKCIKCNNCERVCPPLIRNKENDSLKITYAAKTLDNNIRFESSSGGLFSEFSKKILDENGVVVGAAFNNNWEVKHIFVDNEEELKKLRGSKYVQSDINNTYSIIKKELHNDKKVLFSGCPCQVAGLKAFLNKDYKNLFTIDFICHSIPSQEIFNSYIAILELKFKSKIVDFRFREKSKGWHTSSVKCNFENGKVYTKPITEDMYMLGFLNTVYTKPVCLHCQFKNLKSGSDITISDYWGSEVFEKEIDDNKGLSLVIINSRKGESLFENIKNKVIYKMTDFHNATQYNQRIFSSAIENKKSDAFFVAVKKHGYEYAFNRYCKEKIITTIKRKVRLSISKCKRLIVREYMR